MACIRKVALPVDGSEHSERACDCTYFKEISDFFRLRLVCSLVLNLPLSEYVMACTQAIETMWNGKFLNLLNENKDK